MTLFLRTYRNSSHRESINGGPAYVVGLEIEETKEKRVLTRVETRERQRQQDR